MKSELPIRRPATSRSEKGFALVVTMSLLVLLAVVALGMLSLSAVTLRSGTLESASMEAKANARLALMIALGELQKEMGPDMRVSSESAIFDTNHQTASIDGLAQSRWLASYDSWGSWLNAEYEHPETGNTLTIQDTYEPKREVMFRRWLLSLPTKPDGTALAVDPTAPLALSGWDDGNSVVMVGPGSLGNAAALSRPDEVTRAWLTKVNETGRCAWWIGPENHKAKANLAAQSRNLSLDEWEISAGNTAEVGLSSLIGFDSIDDHPDQTEKLFTQDSIQLLEGMDKAVATGKFFDLTTTSSGLLANVRTGGLKKDLSLLFEKDNSQLPEPYGFDLNTDLQEPSIRPMSPELVDENPKIPGRHFQSWTNMRHFYRMYRSDTDATERGFGGAYVNSGGGTGETNRLKWTNDHVYTDVVSSCNITYVDRYNRWTGSNSYWRRPLLTKLTYIFSTVTIPNVDGAGNPTGSYICRIAHTPVLTYWNPYNISLRVPARTLGMSIGAYDSWPMGVER